MATTAIKLVTPCLGRANESGFGPSMRFGRGSTLACGPCVGGDTAIGGCAVVTGALGTAIGARAHAYDRGTALGAGAYAADGSLAVGEGAKACHTQELILLAGQYDDDASLGRCGNMIKLHNDGAVTFMLQGCATCVSRSQFQNVLRGGASFGTAGNVVIGQCVKGSTEFKDQVIIGSSVSAGSSLAACAVTVVGARSYVGQTAHRATVIGAGSSAGSSDHDAIIIQSGAPCSTPINRVRISPEGCLSLRLGGGCTETFNACQVLNAFRGNGGATWYPSCTSAPLQLQCVRMCSPDSSLTTVTINGTRIVELDGSSRAIRVGDSSLVIPSGGGAIWHSPCVCASLQCIRMCSPNSSLATVTINGTRVVELDGCNGVVRVGGSSLAVSSSGGPSAHWYPKGGGQCCYPLRTICLTNSSLGSSGDVAQLMFNCTPAVKLCSQAIQVGGLRRPFPSAPCWAMYNICGGCSSSAICSLTRVALHTSSAGVCFSVNGARVVWLGSSAEGARILYVGGTSVSLNCLFNASICTTDAYTRVGTGSSVSSCYGTAVGLCTGAQAFGTVVGNSAHASGYSTVIGAGAHTNADHTILIQSGATCSGCTPRNKLQIHCDGSLTFRLGGICRTISANDFFTKLGLNQS